MRTLTRLVLTAVCLTAPASLLAQTPCPTAPVGDHGTPAGGKTLASPAASASVSLDGKSIEIKYNSPSVRCRQIMGGLVPYGQVWRTGANPATSFVTAGDLMIGSLHVPAGSYTLYTLPAAPGTPWMLIVNKQTGQWGTVYKQEQDLGRAEMKTAELPSSQESMTISFENTKKKSTELHIRWEKTDVSVLIRTM